MPGCYVVFHKQLGDLVLLEPALSRLRAHHGEPVRVLTRNGHAPLLHLMQGIAMQRGVPLLPRSHLYCFDPFNKSALRSALAPALVKKCILPEKSEMKWFHPLLFGRVIVSELLDRYVAEYFWDNVPVPATHPFRPPRLDTPPSSWRPTGIGEAPFLLVNPTSGWRRKSWIPSRWAELLQAIHAFAPLPMVMTSGSIDWQIEQCSRIADETGPCLTRLAHGTRLEEFLWLCANAEMILTVDGSASHLAQAFGVPSVTLFGPTSISNWHYETPRNIAIQAPPGKDAARRLRDLPSQPVIELARAIVQSLTHGASPPGFPASRKPV